MSSEVTHTIKTQVIEAKVPRSPSPFETQERIRQLYYKEILPRLEKILDELDPGDETLHIEQLEIDTGNIPVQLLEQELPRRMEEKFRKQLKEKIGGDLPQNAGVSRQAPEERQRAWLRAFLETGNLPWWARPLAAGAFRRTFTEVVPASGGLITSVLSGPRAAEAAQRIWWNLPPENSAELIAALRNETVASAELLAAGLTLRMKGRSLPDWKTLAAFPPPVWEAVFKASGSNPDSPSRLARSGQLMPEKWPENFGEEMAKAAGDPGLAALYKQYGKLFPAMAQALSALPQELRPGTAQRTKTGFADDLNAFRGALLLTSLSRSLTRATREKEWESAWAIQMPEFAGLHTLTWTMAMAQVLAPGILSPLAASVSPLAPASARLLQSLLFRLLDVKPELRVEIAATLMRSGSRAGLGNLLLKRYPDIPLEKETLDRLPEVEAADKESSRKDEKEEEGLTEDEAESRFGKEQPPEQEFAEEKELDSREEELDKTEAREKEEKSKKIREKERKKREVADKEERDKNDGDGVGVVEGQDGEIEISAEEKKSRSRPEIETGEEGLNSHTSGKEQEGQDTELRERKVKRRGTGEEQPLKPHPKVQRPSKRSRGPSWGTPPWRRKAEPEFFISNAGLVLIWPFFQSYFDKAGLLEAGAFRDEAAAMRAAGLLQYLASGRHEPDPEFEYALNKILCGLDPEQPVPPIEHYGEGEIEEAENLLNAVIEYWPALGKALPDSIRGMYLMRKGQIARKDSDFLVVIERNAFDILLDRVPWGFKTLKLPWNRYFIHVEW